MVQMSVRTRACANTHTHTHTHTVEHTGSSCSWIQPRLPKATNSTLMLDIWKQFNSLKSLFKKSPAVCRDKSALRTLSQSGGIGPRALSHVSIAWNHYFLHLRKVIKNNERRRAGLPAISALDLIPHSVPLCPACRKGFLYFPSWSFFLHPGLRISSSNQHA